MNMAELLENAGFKVNEYNGVKPYELMSQCKIPFGSLFNEIDEDKYSDPYKKSLEAINYYRTNAMPFDLSKFEVLEENYVYEWLKENSQKCKIIPNMSIDFYEPYVDSLGDYDEPEDKSEYTTTDIIFHIWYNRQYERFEFCCSRYRFNVNIKEQKDLYNIAANSTFGLENESRFRWFVNNVFDKSEFIPVIISGSDGCMISHNVTKKYGEHTNAVTSPCLGKNIKKNEWVMEMLKGWFDEGGIIKDNNFYLILQNRNPDKPAGLYLRRWDNATDGYKAEKHNGI